MQQLNMRHSSQELGPLHHDNLMNKPKQVRFKLEPSFQVPENETRKKTKRTKKNIPPLAERITMLNVKSDSVENTSDKSLSRITHGNSVEEEGMWKVRSSADPISTRFSDKSATEHDFPDARIPPSSSFIAETHSAVDDASLQKSPNGVPPIHCELCRGIMLRLSRSTKGTSKAPHNCNLCANYKTM